MKLVRYCLCFYLGIFRDGCKCDDCHNNVKNEAARQAVMKITLECNPKAFMGHGHRTQGDRVCNKTFQVLENHCFNAYWILYLFLVDGQFHWLIMKKSTTLAVKTT